MHCSYISFSVLFQTKSSLVWKSYTQKLRAISKPNPVWFGKKKLILQDADSKPNSDWFGNFFDQCQRPENSKPNSFWFGKIIDYCQRLQPIPVLFCKISFQKGKTLKHTYMPKSPLNHDTTTSAAINILQTPCCFLISNANSC